MIISSLLLVAQAATATLPSLAEDRLRLCMDEARTDPATAIATASDWLSEAQGVETSAPQQCLGFAYVSLLRWEATEQAFVAARDARAPDDHAARARMGAMAGNAALADEDFPQAAALLGMAQDDAEAAGLNDVAGAIAADRARALVGSGREEEAGEVLAGAQILAPQVPAVWLLSATLARRQGNLPEAQGLIETAAALAPQDAEIGLELGLIAAQLGDDAAARTAWNSVVALAPQSPLSATARTYLARLDGTVEGR